MLNVNKNSSKLKLMSSSSTTSPSLPTDVKRRAREFTHKCIFNYNYKPITDVPGGLALAGASVAVTVLVSLVAAPAALFGIPLIAAGIAKAAQQEDARFDEDLFNELRRHVIEEPDGSCKFYFIVAGSICELVPRISPDSIVVPNCFLFEASFKSTSLLSLALLH